MSNHYYSNNFGRNFNTFQPNFVPPTFVPPPPKPPPYFIQPVNTEDLDQAFIRNIESKVSTKIKNRKQYPVSISKVRDRLRTIVISLNEIKNKEKILSEKMETCSEEEWKLMLKDINHDKEFIDRSLSDIDYESLDVLRKLLLKRTAKRLRLKRLRVEKKREKEERIKELEERSRKIDENLQKIKDEIKKAKQEEEAKIQADIVLKETSRKKHDAKKCITKLDALKRLRKARQNTARGRGEQVSEKDAREFDDKIENLKSLWAQKLIVYEKEEELLRNKLKEDSDAQGTTVNETEAEVASNLAKWREFLFGDRNASPQVDFNGDISRFIGVRYQWDQFIDESGSSLPVGWVAPSKPA